jgi:50S ribosomal subunit-associated GTPase HflX
LKGRVAVPVAEKVALWDFADRVKRSSKWTVVSSRPYVSLKGQLADIDKQKATQRKNRGRMIRVALVGYTNVGKSTLMNLLSKSDVFAENKLFATLDTTVRKVIIDNLPFLLSIR